MLCWKYNRAYLATTTTTTHLFMKKSMQFAKVAYIFAYNAYITLTNCTTITIFGLMYIFALCIFTNNMANKFNFYIVCARAATCAYLAHFPQLVRISVYTAYIYIYDIFHERLHNAIRTFFPAYPSVQYSVDVYIFVHIGTMPKSYLE